MFETVTSFLNNYKKIRNPLMGTILVYWLYIIVNVYALFNFDKERLYDGGKKLIQDHFSKKEFWRNFGQ
jgi:hypothetical protein